MADADPYEIARQIALRRLTRSACSRAQLAHALRRGNVPEHVAAAVLDRMAAVQLVDDHAFARARVSSRQRARGLARPALARELRDNGVDDETARAVLAEVDPALEIEMARRLVRRWLDRSRGVPVQRRIARLTGMLARRGYPPGLALRTVREALDAEPTLDLGDGWLED